MTFDEDDGFTRIVLFKKLKCIFSSSGVSLFWNHISDVYCIIGTICESNILVAR